MASAASIAAMRVRPAQLARDLKVSRQSISELVQRGVIEKGADGLIDVELAKLALQNRVRPSAKTAQALTGTASAPAPPQAPGSDSADPAAAPPGTVTNYHVAKTLRETANARIDQLRLRKMESELAEVAVMSDGLFRITRMLRDAVLNVPKRVAADAVASGDARVAERLITAGLRAAFEDFIELSKDELERVKLKARAGAGE